RRRRRTGGTIQLDAVLAASNRLSIMHEGLIEQGYSCSGGKLSPSKDGTWTARIVWRHRLSGLSVTFSERGLRIRS
ncbi:hypothetical protein, partial [Starkeya nomas]|uniref:hypothetical protein n=1 Tax=Starkeya nomas TaxID=2666134 RepID=UPI00135CCB11